jgi:parallel beta-helix repeat protein
MEMKLEINMFASRKSSSVRRPLRPASRPAHKPLFETLEERQHFSVVTVTSTGDSGAGTLRNAIAAVNAGKANVIDFNIPKSENYEGMWPIQLETALPRLKAPVTINGNSQPGYDGSPVIEIDGSQFPQAGIGLEAVAGHTTIRGLTLNAFSIGILLDASSSNDTVVGNKVTGFVGTGIQAESNGNTIGTTGDGNTVSGGSFGWAGEGDGIQISGSYNAICGNTSEGNGGDGIHVVTGKDNTIQGNTVEGDFQAAIEVDSADNLIGGYSAGEGNLINQQAAGVYTGSVGDTIVGNSITVTQENEGINANGRQAAPVITSASKFAGLATIKGAVHSKADSFVRVELFASFQEPLDMVPDAPTAQGQTYLGYVEVRTNSQGSATFSDTVVGTPGQLITATATEDGTTGNFSNAVAEELCIVLLPPIHIFNPIRV